MTKYVPIMASYPVQLRAWHSPCSAHAAACIHYMVVEYRTVALAKVVSSISHFKRKQKLETCTRLANLDMVLSCHAMVFLDHSKSMNETGVFQTQFLSALDIFIKYRPNVFNCGV